MSNIITHSPEFQTAQTAINVILDGDAPNAAADQMGKFAELFNEMSRAHSNGGTEAARDIYGKYAEHDPEIAALAAMDAEPAPLPSITTWKIRTLEDAYKEREPLEYLIDGMFSEASLNIVYGPPGSLKSMVLVDACCCIAAGIPWLSPLPVDTNIKPIATIQAPILWIDFDNGTRRTDERFDAIGKAKRLKPETPINYVSMPTPWLDASNSRAVTELAQLVEQLSARFVVIDNLGLIAGNVEENNAEMSQVMGNLRWLAETSGAAVVLIHHQRKGNGSGARKGDTLRGHSSIEAALDLALVIERPDGSDEITITPTKVRGPDPRKLAALFTYSHREGTKELETAQFFGSETFDLKTHEAIDEAIIDLLGQEEEINTTAIQTAVKDATGASVNLIRDRLKYLCKENRVKVNDLGQGKSKLYSLPIIP